MKSFLKKLPVNIFTLLMILAGTVFIFRAVNLITYGTAQPDNASVIVGARAQQAVNEEPPPMDKKDATQAAATEKMPDIKLPGALPPDTSSQDTQRSFSASEIEVLQALAKRRDELNKREQEMVAREALLNAAEQEVDRKITELNKLRGELEKLLGQQQTMEAERIASLVKIYENMKPKEAAEIFNTLDLDILLTVISRMAERKSSPILAAMNTERARLVTIRLAEMRKLPDQKPQPAGR